MKRKFKILILTISVIAMLFAFAIVSSAAVPETFDDSLDKNTSWFGESDYTEYSNWLIALRDNDGRQLAYFMLYSDVGSAIYREYGNSQVSIEEFSHLYQSNDFYFIDMVVNYVNFFNYLNNNSYDSLGEFGELREFQYARDVYLSLKNSYTQSDLDNAVAEYKNSTEYKLDVLEEVKKITGGESEGLEVFYDDYTQILGAPSVVEGFIPFGENKSLYLGVAHGERLAFIVDSSMLREFCSLNNISNRSEFVMYVRNTYLSRTPEGEYGYPGLTDNQYYEIENVVENSDLSNSDFDNLFSTALNYFEITSDIVDSRYNEGKLEGVEEFKNSEEYVNSLDFAKTSGVEEFKSSEEYSNILNFAKTSGIEEFKNSTEYNEALLSKYNEGHSVGTSSGITAYKSSSEYKTALSDKYDEGYDVGFSEGEKSFDFGPIIVGILVLSSIAIGLIIYNQKRRKKYRR